MFLVTFVERQFPYTLIQVYEMYRALVAIASPFQFYFQSVRRPLASRNTISISIPISISPSLSKVTF